jgi:4-amino-4-deoxy-L-arabinose transferase-like glycosyltransferase
LLIPAVLLMAGLRSADLRSDPYRGLDWDTGIITDEGFYCHNARNLALFGRERLDEFNNMLVSPLLHYLQVVVFKAAGFSSVNSRGISVVLSLLTIAALFASLRRAFGPRVAITAALFLGLDHFNLLFNRMALNDTPAAFLAVCSLYAFVRFVESAGTSRAAWIGTAGALLGMTLVTRSLCIYLIPTGALAVWFAGDSLRARSRDLIAIIAGISLVIFIYAAWWYLPHRVELNHMNAYYRTVQAQPDSVVRFLRNVRIAFLGDQYGVFPNLVRHTPVIFGLALLFLGGWAAGFRARSAKETAVLRILALWVVTSWLVFAVSSYSPNRYFVTTFPALFGLAGFAIWRLREILHSLMASGIRSWFARTAITWILTYHAVEWLLHRSNPWMLYGIATAAALAVGFRAARLSATVGWKPAVALIALWAGINGGWLANWWLNREYTLYQSSVWLEGNLPRGSILLGDVAPGLAMDTAFQAVNVMKGFANDARPVESFAPEPRYILTIDGSWKTPYWIERYPRLVDPARRVRHWRVSKWMIGLYPAD